MTLALLTPDRFTDTTLPLYPLESVPGTILHIEPARSPSLVGVPANNSTIPNLATWMPAAGVVVKSSNMVAGVGVVERSTKGGIHAIRTQANTFCQWGIVPNQAVRQYLQDNIGHKFYLSTHGRITRTPVAGGNAALDAHWTITFSTAASDTRLLMAALANAVVNPVVNSNIKVTKKYPEASLVGAAASPFYMGAAVQGYTGPIDIDAAGSELKTPLFMVGAGWPFNNSGTGGASKLFYRAFLEDLTVSGRSETEIRDIDYAWFNADVLSAGGRYYGDTYTAPSTLP